MSLEPASPGGSSQGAAVFLGDRRNEERERLGYADAFRRLGWDVEWWPHEDLGLRSFLDRSGRAIVIHPEGEGAPVPADVTGFRVPTVTFQIDAFAYPEVRIRRSMLFDIVCCFHPGWIERYRREGHPGPILTAHAIDDARFGEIERHRPTWDVGWVGRVDGPLYEGRRQLLPVLASRFRMNDWRSATRSDQIGAVYGRSRVVVNIPRDDWRTDANLRAFEAMGAGALLITPVPSELTELGLVDGEHFVGFRSDGEVVDLVAQYLDDAPARGRIARAGRKRVLSDHTYVRRVESVLELAFGPRRPVAPARAWPRSAVAQRILEQYTQERRWSALVGPARGLFPAAGWRSAAAAWYLASRVVSHRSRATVVGDG